MDPRRTNAFENRAALEAEAMSVRKKKRRAPRFIPAPAAAPFHRGDERFGRVRMSTRVRRANGATRSQTTARDPPGCGPASP